MTPRPSRCRFYLILVSDVALLRSVAEVSVELFTKRLPTRFRVWLENEEHPVEASSWCGSREVIQREHDPK